MSNLPNLKTLFNLPSHEWQNLTNHFLALTQLTQLTQHNVTGNSTQFTQFGKINVS